MLRHVELFRASLVLLAALVCATAYAAEPATVTFTLDFPNSSPEHYSIVVQSDGHAKYESSGRISPDSDERTDYNTDFAFSEATRARIFALAAQAHYFSGKVDSGNKKLAFTGTKKLSYQGGQHDSSATYNFSPVPAVQQLTNLFQSVGATLEFGRRLTFYHHYQKLALDEELKRMEDQARHGEIAELQAVTPVLQEIYEDSSVINVVRARARRIIDMSPAAAAGGSTPTGVGTTNR
jgi:hypothetical protein